jgi:hypothetical protein
MKQYKFLTILVVLGLLVFVGLVMAQDGSDGRINVAHHFGGDTMYCTAAEGCWMLNMTGQPLWSVAEATIDAALATACETGAGQVIEAGQGTYGPFQLVVNCNTNNHNNMVLMGYDEWGKTNEMPFSSLYQPVQGYDTNLCMVEYYWIDTGDTAFYDVFNDGGDGVWDNWNAAGYVTTLDENPRLPYCIWNY